MLRERLRTDSEQESPCEVPSLGTVWYYFYMASTLMPQFLITPEKEIQPFPPAPRVPGLNFTYISLTFTLRKSIMEIRECKSSHACMSHTVTWQGACSAAVHISSLFQGIMHNTFNLHSKHLHVFQVPSS